MLLAESGPIFSPRPTRSWNVTNNTVNAGSSVTGDDGLTNGIFLSSLENGVAATLSGNTVGGAGGQFARGVELWNLPTAGAISVSGGSIGKSVTGIGVTNNDPEFGTAE